MKKTCVLLAGIILVILLAFACEMPNSIEIKTDKFQINAPVKIGRFNLATILTAALKDSFPEGFEIYDMVNYRSAQALLIGYPRDIMESFNPDDYLKNLTAGGIPDINQTITIPPMTTNTVTQDWFYFGMVNFFQDMEDRINADSTPETEVDLIVTHSENNDEVSIDLATHGLNNLPNFMVFKAANPTQNNFESAFVHTGRIELNIHLEIDGNLSTMNADDITIKLAGIDMIGANSTDRIGNHTSPLTAQVNSTHDENNPYKVIIDIDNTEIVQNDPPRFTISSVTSYYTGNSTTPETLKFKLVIQPQVRNITLRGARALKIGRMEKGLDDPELADLVDSIVMAPIPDMINAEIESGTFKIVATPPHSNPDAPVPSNTTYCRGMEIGYEIIMRQDPPDPVYGVSDCLDDETFTDSPGGDLLDTKWISGKELTVDSVHSTIIIQADPVVGVTFELFNDQVAGGYDHAPFDEKVLPINVDTFMNIDKLSLVRWKSSVLPPIDIPEINFANLGEEDVSFIKTITFSEINLNIDFGDDGLPPELENHIALKVNCPDLGFNDQTEVLDSNNDGVNTITNEAPYPPGTILNVEGVGNKVNFDAELIPVINGSPAENSPYIEFGPVTMDGKDIVMNINAQVGVDFFWEKADIDLNAALTQAGMNTDELTGTFPEETGDGVDLSEVGNYLKGINFSDSLAAKIFFAGPHEVIDLIDPKISFAAKWTVGEGSEGQDLIDSSQPLVVENLLPPLPGKSSRGEWVYSGAGLPPGNGFPLTGFNNVISAFPQDLRFHYEMELQGETGLKTIYPSMFEGVEGDSKIKALLVLLVPLEFVAEPGGSFEIPKDIFGISEVEEWEKREDLFGRKDPNDSSPFTGVKIKSLGIKIDFGFSFFNGAYLHFDEKKRLFGDNGLYMGEGNGLNIILTDAQRKAIDENLIFPQIRLEYHERKILRISRSFLPARIVIAASGSYTLNLDDLGLGN